MTEEEVIVEVQNEKRKKCLFIWLAIFLVLGLLIILIVILASRSSDNPVPTPDPPTYAQINYKSTPPSGKKVMSVEEWRSHFHEVVEMLTDGETYVLQDGKVTRIGLGYHSTVGDFFGCN